jgi:hypothetical protein
MLPPNLGADIPEDFWRLRIKQSLAIGVIRSQPIDCFGSEA